MIKSITYSLLTYHTAWIYIYIQKGSESSLSIIYYLPAFTMLPDLDAFFVLNYFQNPTPDDGVRVALEQTLDPTPNDPPT